MKYRLIVATLVGFFALCVHGAALAFGIWLWSVHAMLGLAFALFWIGTSVFQFVIGLPAASTSWQALGKMDRARVRREAVKGWSVKQSDLTDR